MKAHRNNPPPKFEPVILTLETQAEVDAIYVVINHLRISKALGIGDLRPDILEDFADRNHCNDLHSALGKLF